MPRLIHLNGPTGVGKSTIAARYAADHPGTLNLDADEVVRLVGGWQDDFYGAVGLVRPLAIAMAVTHLSSGNDVVMPQLVARRDERDRFAQAARSAGADYIEFVLLAAPETTIDRFRHRDHPIDPAVEALGGATLIRRIHDHLAAYLTPRTAVIQTEGAEPGRTYEELLAALAA
ncbi:Predicted kinase [Lentzea xinjiangensis]|uniref:Predicted kinase n=1 Tax=Lentzea xinjiangensis TaxID=402600 RepID=A0A1H9KX97_9PSEU|nr:AAA family ATPase [Lentzea xinjiangensis]SER03565.1 Predicted kinase [Lentzea xinjiangensis]